MNTNVVVPTHNPKNETVVQVVELGSAAQLTWGIPSTSNESRTRQHLNIHMLGNATTLTMGGGSGGAETRNRPFGSGGGSY